MFRFESVRGARTEVSLRIRDRETPLHVVLGYLVMVHPGCDVQGLNSEL